MLEKSVMFAKEKYLIGSTKIKKKHNINVFKSSVENLIVKSESTVHVMMKIFLVIGLRP